MAAEKNDLPLRGLRKAAGKAAPAARLKAFEAGVSVVDDKDGMIVCEGAVVEVRVVVSSAARDVVEFLVEA